MKALIFKSGYGQYSDYEEHINSVWVRDEPFDWEDLQAQFKRITDNITKVNNEISKMPKKQRKAFIPHLSLEQFLLANDFVQVEFQEQRD